MSPKPDPVYFLLVDDLEENLLSLEALLRRDGLILLKARSGTEALELLLQYEVALALLDVQMPVMDGFELAELMRGNERTGRVPIIFLTAGSADRQRRFRGYETGAVDFLHKPIEPDVLRSKAQVFFELFRQRQQLARQRDELKANADALTEADRRKDEFLAVLAHELRNPLAPIRNGLQIMQMSSDPKTSQDIRAMMDRQVTHLVRLIDDLLDVSRVSRGKIDLRKEHVTVQAALQAAVEASQPVIESKRHCLSLEITDTPLWIEADLTRISQVVSNLLNNAAKYTPEGGDIRLSVISDLNTVTISVSDTGLGIPREMLSEIFELFTQVEHGDRSKSGLGIGLALARQLVDLHQGTIEADSPGVGRGSTFTVRLPLAENVVAPASHDAHPTDEATPLKVLIVDDNISSAESTGQMLSMIGHETSLAHDGLSALEEARRMRPDVILLDIGLPSMNGYEVCRRLRQDPAFQETKLIAQTGWGQERDRQKAAEAGFDHHMTKPINFRELSTILARKSASAA
jgi:signal transduction histidine kinase